MIESAIKIAQSSRRISEKIQFLGQVSELHDLLVNDHNPVIEVIAPNGQVRRMQIAGADEALVALIERREAEEETQLRELMRQLMPLDPVIDEALKAQNGNGEVAGVIGGSHKTA